MVEKTTKNGKHVMNNIVAKVTKMDQVIISANKEVNQKIAFSGTLLLAIFLPYQSLVAFITPHIVVLYEDSSSFFYALDDDLVYVAI